MRFFPLVVSCCIIALICCGVTTSYAGDIGIVNLDCYTKTSSGVEQPLIKLRIDFPSGTVNGHHAQITDNEIRWEVKDVIGVINRHTGYIRMGTEKSPLMGQGHCQQAADR